MYGDPTTTPGGKALKFYCSVRVQIARVGGSQEKVKIGGEEVVVGHTIRATIKKNKVAPPFRKAEFNIYYDGRETDPADEIAAVALLKGLIPKFDSAGNLSATGRTYRLEVDGEVMEAKKKDDVASELKKCPKVQEYLINALKNGVEVDQVQEQDEFSSEMSDEDFEKMALQEAGLLKKGIKPSEAEETSTNWDDI